MPLRDHFRPPLDDVTSWEGFHGGWPMVIGTRLNRQLPPQYVAEPRVHVGSAVEIDVPTFEKDEGLTPAWGGGNGNGGVAIATWAPPRPTAATAAPPPAIDEYEVRVYDRKRNRRLVAAIEIVSPSNKDRPEHRRAFANKCAELYRCQVCVAIVDLVTTRAFNLYAELLDRLVQSDPLLVPEPPTMYAAVCRLTAHEGHWLFESWAHSLAIGQPLPTLPLWIASDFAVPLELEETYEETCRNLRIP